MGWKIYLRRICLECTATHGWIGPVFWYLPFPNTCAKDWILSGRLVHHIWHPSVPPGLKLRSVLYSLEPAVQHSAEPLLTLRTLESPLCNPPILSVLWYHKPLDFCVFFGQNIQGNSSSKFSKYLLPNRSFAINVPALVSPATKIRLLSKHHVYCPTYQCTKSWRRRSEAVL